MFLTVHNDAHAKALEEWREAARLVSTRWATVREAQAESRQWAFASYVAALDAEEAAAAMVATLTRDDSTARLPRAA
jgi:hypothetical protein